MPRTTQRADVHGTSVLAYDAPRDHRCAAGPPAHIDIDLALGAPIPTSTAITDALDAPVVLGIVPGRSQTLPAHAWTRRDQPTQLYHP